MKLGAHVSIGGGLAKAAINAQLIGCETFQIFTSNPRGWSFNERSGNDIAEFKKIIQEHDIGPVFGHAIYLTNLASQNPFIYTNSINSLVSGLALAEQAGFLGVITHIGAAGESTKEEATARVVNALEQALTATDGYQAKIILETDSGSGSHLGGSFNEIGEIINRVGSKRVSVCLDTCHIFAAGYDIRTEKGINATLNNFEKEIGLSRLVALHLNDSKGELGTHLDRHEEIGKGRIGLEAFKTIVNHPLLNQLAGVIETPDNKSREGAEKGSLDILKELRDE